MKRTRILAVDDNVINLQSLVQELQDKYEVVAMISGKRALRYLEKEKVDLILLDVMMPEIDGIEMLKKIREMKGGLTIPVIFLTASNYRETVMSGIQLGIADFIVKPFQREDLRFRIDRTLKKQGVVPVEQWELCQAIGDLSGFVEKKDWKNAKLKATEVVGYKAGEGVINQVKTILKKLEVGDYPAVKQAAGQLMKMINGQGDSQGEESESISQLEWTTKLYDVLESMDQFDFQGAMEKMNLLMSTDMPEKYSHVCQRVMDCLRVGDNMEVEKLILQILDDVAASA
jgi:response regulator RpfG family c-di-GMP phosphodiesterase